MCITDKGHVVVFMYSHLKLDQITTNYYIGYLLIAVYLYSVGEIGSIKKWDDASAVEPVSHDKNVELFHLIHGYQHVFTTF